MLRLPYAFRPMQIKIGRSCRGNFRRARSFLAVGGIVFAAVIPSLVRAQTVTATVLAGTFPHAVAVDPVTNTIYVANDGDNTVTVIDGATNTVTATVSAGTDPNAVAVDPVTNTIYVANFGSDNVTVIDGATNTVTATVAVGTNPQLLQFHSILLRTNTTGALHMPLTLSRSILSKSNSKMGPYRS